MRAIVKYILLAGEHYSRGRSYAFLDHRPVRDEVTLDHLPVVGQLL